MGRVVPRTRSKALPALVAALTDGVSIGGPGRSTPSPLLVQSGLWNRNFNIVTAGSEYLSKKESPTTARPPSLFPPSVRRVLVLLLALFFCIVEGRGVSGPCRGCTLGVRASGPGLDPTPADQPCSNRLGIPCTKCTNRRCRQSNDERHSLCRTASTQWGTTTVSTVDTSNE